MNLISQLTFFLIICIIEFSQCFIWVPLKSGDQIPANAIRLDSTFKKYVGRTKYLNTLQLAEIHEDAMVKRNITHAVIILYSNEIVRHKFEVLVATEHCEWVWFDKTNVPTDIVHGGTAWSNEPVFTAKRQTSYDVGIASILLSSNKIHSSPKFSEGHTYALTCDQNHTWIDATSTEVPENSVNVDINNNNPNYVARLLGPVSHIPGEVVPSMNQTFVYYQGYDLKSFDIQVLVEEPQQYRWQEMKPGSAIPDYAVVCGISERNELIYIGKQQGVLPVVFSNMPTIFDILVKI